MNEIPQAATPGMTTFQRFAQWNPAGQAEVEYLYLSLMKRVLYTAFVVTIIALATTNQGCDGDPELPGPIVSVDTTVVTPGPNVNIEDLKMNELQAIGSHNSYRLKTYAPLLAELLSWPSPPPGLNPEELDYTHEPLLTQFDSFNMRSIEIDIYYDPNGGAYYNRQGNVLIMESTDSNEPELQNPGMKVLHILDVDYLTHHLTFVSALNSIKAWSDANPNHLPLIVMVEAKEDGIQLPFFADPVLFDAAAFDAMDLEVESVFGSGSAQVVTPDDFRGTYNTVNEAAMAGAWPTLAQSRGTIYFVLMLSSSMKIDYLAGHPDLTGRTMFFFGNEGESEIAFLKYDDPIADQNTIMSLVQAGYMVRTRCDEGTLESRNGDYSKMNMAFSSGAQIVSTDYYRPDERAPTDPGWSDYSVSFPNKEVARLNPVNGPVEYIGKVIDD